MDSFREWVKKEDKSTKTVHAVTDLAEALAKAFKKYALHTREKAWELVTSKDGEKAVKDLLKNPSRPLNQFRKLA